MKKIVLDNKANYVINLKGNQETLQEEVKDYFSELEQSGELERLQKLNSKEPSKTAGDRGNLSMHSTLKKGHGRIEKRTYFYSTDNKWMVDAKRNWEKLTGIGKVVREVGYPAEST